ncbi:uncharacterized protein LOC117107731 [Anneissia japonica]|uniref:uncharacterized protein LOC117107731 n=1 Tax=Anneissia japonica TaxID=1529436 RepID=UPI001425A640|nr:uncharacterized protein LOC117107731 [Anneissia japonica]
MAQQAWCFDSVSHVCTCSVPQPSLDVPKLPLMDGSIGFLSSKSNVAIICVLTLVVVAGILTLLVFVYRHHQRIKSGLLNNASNYNFHDSSQVLPMQESEVGKINLNDWDQVSRT